LGSKDFEGFPEIIKLIGYPWYKWTRASIDECKIEDVILKGHLFFQRRHSIQPSGNGMTEATLMASSQIGGGMTMVMAETKVRKTREGKPKSRNGCKTCKWVISIDSVLLKSIHIPISKTCS
jgi:hypothetical protein